MGRPSTFDPMVACEVCELIASGLSLRKACRVIGLQHKTFLGWVVADREGIYAHYARAREAQAELLADQIVRISDIGNKDDYNRARLRVDTRKWVASKMAPKRYGDRKQIEHSGEVDHNVKLGNLSDDELADMVRRNLG